jgi:hypothetical protein
VSACIPILSRYRDLQLNVVFVDDEGHDLIWELQVHLAPIEELKSSMRDAEDGSGRTGHQRYVLDDAAASQGALTPS